MVPENVKSFHFLVVDDFESMRLMNADALKKMGIKKISFASSGNEAFQKIKDLASTDPVNFVLSDLIMQNGTGLDLVKHLRGYPGTATLPIVMVSSKTEINHIMDCVMAGASDFVTKPWKIEELAKKISDITSGRKKS